MKNLVTKDFIGGTFIDWVRNNYDVAQQHETFFSLFDKACAKNKVDLYKNVDDTLKAILTKNRKTVTYVEGYDTMVNYFCEDTCHKVHGFNALTDIGFPYLYDDALGVILMYMYDDYAKQDNETKEWMDKFATYLCPKIMERLVKMTKEFIGAESEHIDENTLKCIWREESSESLPTWIASFEGLIMYDDAEDYIADYLDFNVLHPAIGAVEGDMELSDAKYCELHDYVSCSSWTDMIKLMNGDSNAIKDVRKELNLFPTKIELCGATWDKVGKSPLDETDGVDAIWWHCGTFTEGDLWEENVGGRFCLIRPNGDILVRYF